ncbi:Glycoside hydrolase, family 3, N-terminal [Dillenia turbinata]|uniref:Glycoside hydrolase, family 3, N-terminal n=1 Tax=Dillenia turbinata TaxID=194707 RepID=A0AAN8VFE4_9MAGN
MKFPTAIFGLLLICCAAGLTQAEYSKYKDPRQPLNVRIKDLMNRMTLEEKIGQMTQIERTVASADVMKKYYIGSVLSGGGSVPAVNASAETWIKMVNEFQMGALSTRLGIPMIYGIDAVHGHGNVYNATIFPHNVGLGVTRQVHDTDPELARKIGAATALEVRATGIPYVFAPCIALERSKDARQSIPCHQIPQGNPQIQDWQGIDRITSPPDANYSYSVQTGIHAGIDMIMVPYNFTEFIGNLTFQVKNNIIPMSRIDDAVHRILRVKFMMGLFENPMADLSLVNQLGSPEHRALAREAVRKTLVLLKNGKTGDKPLLPLSKKATKILVAGTHADNLGYQCGGWTITWQGLSGNNLTSDYVKAEKFDYAIVVVGEHSYAEGYGDSLNLTISDPGDEIISNVCGAVRCVVVVISGRPVVIEPYVASIDALVAAWLPGTEGQGVTDVLFGDYGFTGKLARTWFKNVDQLPMNVGDDYYDPLYPFGFGLTTEPNQV